jgi:hypothetical protein
LTVVEGVAVLLAVEGAVPPPSRLSPPPLLLLLLLLLLPRPGPESLLLWFVPFTSGGKSGGALGG